MEFQYIYILQDILGLLIAFLYSRLLFLSIKLVFVKGLNMKVLRVMMHQLILLVAGMILIFNPWAFKTGLQFIFLIVIAVLIGPKRKESNEYKL